MFSHPTHTGLTPIKLPAILDILSSGDFMPKRSTIFSATMFFPLVVNAYPALLFQGTDFSGRLDFNVELPVHAGSFGYYRSDILENWKVVYSNGSIIDPSNTIIYPGYRKDGKYAALGFEINNAGLLSYLEFYVVSTSGNHFDLEIRRDAAGNLYEDYGRADITLVQNTIPEPGIFKLLIAAMSSMFFLRKRSKNIGEMLSIFSRWAPRVTNQ